MRWRCCRIGRWRRSRSCRLRGRVEDDVRDEGAVEVGLYAEVFVLLGRSDNGAEVRVAIRNLDVRGVFAVMR